MKSFPLGRVAFFVTGNVHKFDEARRVLAEYDIAATMLKVNAIEIQHDHIEEIARTRAKDAVKKCGLPIIVEDAGLFVKALRDFPGPYSSYTYRTIGSKGILRLMEKVEEREAHFHSAVAFSSPDEPPRCFHGCVKGEISEEERGSHGFGFDPIFKPANGHDRTFAEMTKEQKNRHSHRGTALRGFAKWYRHAFKNEVLQT
jgi:XTP/dITP diphosphohydrolase